MKDFVLFAQTEMVFGEQRIIKWQGNNLMKKLFSIGLLVAMWGLTASAQTLPYQISSLLSQSPKHSDIITFSHPSFNTHSCARMSVSSRHNKRRPARNSSGRPPFVPAATQ